MVLVLVLHELESITATVPMYVLALDDMKKRKQLPIGFRLRQVIPTNGKTSTSLWDITDLTLFEEWLNESLGPGVTHTILQVVEQFTYNTMSAVNSGRAADKARDQMTILTSSTKNAVSRAGEQITDFDKKYEISGRTAQTIKKVSDAASQAKSRAMENPTIAKMSSNVNASMQAGWKSMNVGLDWARERFNSTLAIRPSTQTTPTAEQHLSDTLLNPDQTQSGESSSSRPPPQTGPQPVFDLTGDDDDRVR